MPIEIAPPKRIPLEIDGIQVNFCKNPACGNFLSPASVFAQARGRNTKQGMRDSYTVSGRSDGMFLICDKCKECPPIKSNLGIAQEINRISEYLKIERKVVSCRKYGCDNHGIDAYIYDERYWKFGKTKFGSPRFRCKLCGSTCSEPQTSIHKQKLSHLNASIFKSLLGKQPLKSIANEEHISMKTLYDKIDFIHRQCMAFAASREKLLPELKRKYLNISVDRQAYSINWRDCKDRRNVVLYAVGSADSQSGYVFGIHLNFDPSHDPNDIEKDAVAEGDYELQRPFRKYARFWLARDYEEALQKNPGKEKESGKVPLKKKVEGIYEAALSRSDIEAYDQHNSASMLPLYGMQVHAEYTMYAHFFLLRKQLANIGKIRFYLDQDSGIRAACLAAFADRILEKRCDAFYVTIRTDYTQNQKLGMVQKGKIEKEEFLHRRPEYADLLDIFIRREIIKERLASMEEIGSWKDKWLDYPFPDMSEPDKMACYLTNIKKGVFDRDLEGLAYMFERASLHPIDRFFAQCRRACSILERSIRSTSRSGRVWQLYNAYDPGIVMKLLEIHRAYYNYVKLTEGRKRPKGLPKRKPGEARKAMKTPAMRLGLAKGPISIEDILYFKP